MRDAIRRGFDSGTGPRPLIESSLRVGHEAVLEAGRSDRSRREWAARLFCSDAASSRRRIRFVAW